MKIAVIGSGVSGNVVARLLSDEHEVHLFEAKSYPGGHTRTVDVDVLGRPFTVDTGFMVFNERTYPNFCRLLEILKIPSQASDMSFSVRCERTGLEYQGSGLNGLFAQRANLVNPGFLNMLRDILRFNRQSLEVLSEPEPGPTMGEYLARRRYGRRFVQQYLVPMAAAIWSCRPDHLLDFPARFLVAFFQNHGLLQVRNRPQWRTIPGGARNYVQALLEPLGGRLRLNCPVTAVQRHEDHVLVQPAKGEAELFDHVIFAAHADQVAGMLRDADSLERETLTAFPYQQNQAVLHTDTRWLPRRQRAWASWNYHIPKQADCPVAVTYNLSRLQQVRSPLPILLTLNPTSDIAEEQVLRRFRFDHPAYSLSSPAAQRRQLEMNGRRRTWYCGAYWGYGFHEDGVNSALIVAKAFGKSLDSCTVVSTRAECGIGATSR